MAVHNLSAPNLTVTHWSNIESFPRDGSVVMVRNKDGHVGFARWWGGQMTGAVKNPTEWRPS